MMVARAALLAAAPDPPPILRAPGEPPTIAMNPSGVRFLIDSEATGGAWSMAELTEQPGGFERHLRDRAALAREVAADSPEWPARLAALRAKNRALIEELGTWQR